jgi:hypothetical protein
VVEELHNPKHPGDWWDRKLTPNDEKQYDLDPEDYHGVMTGERQPRIAAATVKEMFATSSSTRVLPAAAVAMLAVLAAGG